MTNASRSAIVGFDLGHGQTALAVTHADKETYPAVLDLPGSVGRQHVTAVAEHPSRGVLVGEEAAGARGISQLWLGFKSPDLDQESVSRPTILFVGKIVADLRSDALIPASGVNWVVGAPSGWTAPVRKTYAKVLEKAGLAKVEVISESRAALLYARDSGDVGVGSDELKRPVLIIDIGSSTTDYTSVVGLQASPVDHGNTKLGASLIDREILRYLLARHPLRAQVEEVMLDSPTERLRLELVCRRLKEDYYRAPRERFRDDPDARVSQLVEVAIRDGYLDVAFRLSKADMDAVLAASLKALNGQSWVEAFRGDVKNALARLTTPPEIVVLTGGPSRMDFVLEVCQAAVGPKTAVVRGAEPEYSIARGLALAGRISVKAAGFRADLKKLFNSKEIDELVTEKLPDLTSKMGTAVASGITDRHIIPAFRQWRNGEISTLDGMSSIITAKVNNEISSGEITAAAISDWQNALRPDLDELTRPICRRWGIPRDALSLPEIAFAGSSHSVVVDTTAATSALDSIGNAVAVVVAIIGGTILGGGGTALLAAGPIGWVIGAAAVGGAAIVGKEALMDKAKGAEIPVSLRKVKGEQSMVDKLRSEAPATERRLATDLAQGFLSENGEKLASETVRSILAQLEARADEAELLIS